MIEIVGGSSKDQHDFFELLRMLYPQAEDAMPLRLSLRREEKKLFYRLCGERIIEGWVGGEEEEARTALKRLLVKDLVVGEKRPSLWGTLIGIRPTKLVLQHMEESGEERARKILRDSYAMSSFGERLLVETAKREKPILESTHEDAYSVYLHIPFCPSKCHYCSYPTMLSSKRELVDTYVDALLEHLEAHREFVNQAPVSLYIGGGTPSAIPHTKLLKIVEKMVEVFGEGQEFTVECGRPDTIDATLLRGLRGLGVNRISINPQTMHDETLSALGRTHGEKEILDALELAREIGFEAINMDLILGLPGEGRGRYLSSLEGVLKEKPENITIHCLSLKNGAYYHEEGYEEGFDEREVPGLVEESYERLQEAGYGPYYLYRQKRTLGNGVNVGYALPKKASLYNVLMMEEQHSIFGIGMSSTTKFYFPEENRLERVYQYKNLRDYKDQWRVRHEKVRKLYEEWRKS